MSSLLLSRADLDFLLYDWLKIDELTERERYAEHSRETFDAALDLSEALANEHFAPHNKKADANEPRFEYGKVVMIPEVGAALKRFGEAGLFAAQADYDLGGMQLPATVNAACFAFFKAANTGTAAYAMLTTAAANLLRRHGAAEQVARYVEPMLSGRFFGTMALSEPQAGSSLGRRRHARRSTRDESARIGPQYRVSGKMWISGGDHELVGKRSSIWCWHEGRGTDGQSWSPGTKGVSLLCMVPKYLVTDDGCARRAQRRCCLAGLNHKMGYRGTVNTLAEFRRRHRV